MLVANKNSLETLGTTVEAPHAGSDCGFVAMDVAVFEFPHPEDANPASKQSRFRLRRILSNRRFLVSAVNIFPSNYFVIHAGSSDSRRRTTIRALQNLGPYAVMLDLNPALLSYPPVANLRAYSQSRSISILQSIPQCRS